MASSEKRSRAPGRARECRRAPSLWIHQESSHQAGECSRVTRRTTPRVPVGERLVEARSLRRQDRDAGTSASTARSGSPSNREGIRIASNEPRRARRSATGGLMRISSIRAFRRLRRRRTRSFPSPKKTTDGQIPSTARRSRGGHQCPSAARSDPRSRAVVAGRVRPGHRAGHWRQRRCRSRQPRRSVAARSPANPGKPFWQRHSRQPARAPAGRQLREATPSSPSRPRSTVL